MADESDRLELERRFEQVRRLLAGALDQTTRDRLTVLALEIEDQLRKSASDQS